MARSIKENKTSISAKEALEAVRIKIEAAEPITDIDHCPAALYLQKKKLSGRRSHISQMKKIARWISDYDSKDEKAHLRIPWHKLNVDDIQWIQIVYLERGYSPATTVLAMSTLKGIAKQSWTAGWVDDKQWIRIRDWTIKTDKNKALTGRELSENEIRALISACQDGTPWGVRDMAILSLLSGTGMRRGTIMNIEMKNLRDDNTIIAVEVKGGKFHEHPLPQGCQMALNAWLKIRGRSGVYLFNPINKKAEIQSDKRLSSQAIYRIMTKRIQMAHIVNATPHDLRRSFITDLIRKYGLSIAQDFAGHASPETTKRYDRSTVEERVRIARKIQIPFVEN